MSRRQAVLAFTIVFSAFVSGVVVGQQERFELEGNLKFFGVGSGIIFPDGSKQTTAGVGSSNDLVCTDCVSATDIAASAVGTSEVIDGSLTSDDLGIDSVFSAEIAANGVGADEIAAAAVGTSEVADNTLTANDLATDSVGSAEIAASAVGTSEVADNTLTAGDLATDSVGSAEIAAGAVGSSEVAAKSLTLSNVSMTVFQNYQVDLLGVINNGSCSNFSGQGGLSGVAAGSFALVYDVRMANNAANPGWVIESETSPTGAADSIKVRVCNYTGGNADPPNLRFSFWTIAQ